MELDSAYCSWLVVKSVDLYDARLCEAAKEAEAWEGIGKLHLWL